MSKKILKVMAGVLFAMVVIVIGGTAAFAQGPDPNNVPCMVFCNPKYLPPDGPCGAGANNVAQHVDGTVFDGGIAPGASGHAQMNVFGVPLH